MAPRTSKNKFKSPAGDSGDHRSLNQKNKFKPDKNSFKNKQQQKRQEKQNGKSPQNGKSAQNGKSFQNSKTSQNGSFKFNDNSTSQNGKSSKFGKQNGKSPKNAGKSSWNTSQNGKPKFVKGQQVEKVVPKKQKPPMSDSDDEEDVPKKPVKQSVSKKAKIEDFKPRVQAVNTKQTAKKGKGKPVVSDSDDSEDIPPPKSAAKLKTKIVYKDNTTADETRKPKKKVQMQIDEEDESDDEEMSFEDADFEDMTELEDEEETDAEMEDSDEEDVPPVASKKQEKAAKKSETVKESKAETKKKEQPAKVDKTTKGEGQKEGRKAEKRVATDEINHSVAKKNRPLNEVDSEIIKENHRRRVERDNRAIFLNLSGKKDRAADSSLKALHPDILVVSRLKKAAFLVFLSEAVRDKAYKQLQKAHLKGKPVSIDYCGDKGKRPHGEPDVNNTQINLLQLVISDLPSETQKSSLEIIFPKATEIAIMNKKQIAFLSFGNEADAREAWDKGKSLKVGGVPIMVRYRTFNNEGRVDEAPKKVPLDTLALKKVADAKESKTEKPSKTAAAAKASVQSKVQEESDDEEVTDEEADFEDGEFEDAEFEDFDEMEFEDDESDDDE
ncbi:hypothetical protein M3Y96_01198500 [Aphelenchoides besseyi]|nr:hypothetical protein M3Y96_01198500 [Aphelenchoides besseyi]